MLKGVPMKRNLFLVVLTLFACSICMAAPKLKKSSSGDKDYQLCYQLFEAMNMEKSLQFTADGMVDTQIDTLKQTGLPNAEKLRPALKKFMRKIFTYDNIKKDMAQIYLKHFTTEELKALLKFYQTPEGRKIAEKQSAVTVEASKLGAQLVLDHQDELVQAITEAMGEE